MDIHPNRCPKVGLRRSPRGSVSMSRLFVMISSIAWYNKFKLSLLSQERYSTFYPKHLHHVWQFAFRTQENFSMQCGGSRYIYRPINLLIIGIPALCRERVPWYSRFFQQPESEKKDWKNANKLLIMFSLYIQQMEKRQCLVRIHFGSVLLCLHHSETVPS